MSSFRYKAVEPDQPFEVDSAYEVTPLVGGEPLGIVYHCAGWWWAKCGEETHAASNREAAAWDLVDLVNAEADREHR